MDFRFDVEFLQEVDDFLSDLDKKPEKKFCTMFGNQG